MLAAMKRVLGDHISQAGSQLGEDEIRFDFSHFQACTPEELRSIERIVNDWLTADLPVQSKQMSLVRAKEMGVTAVFDEKYGSEVRVVSIGEGESGSIEGWVSRELCGGTHLDSTSQAGMFLIVKEESVQSGVRRIYAVTGRKAFSYVQAARAAVDWLGGYYKRPLPHPSGLTIANLDGYTPQAEEWRNEMLGKIEGTEQKYQEARQAAIEARRDLVVGGLVGELNERVYALADLHVLITHLKLGDRADLKYIVERYAGSEWQNHFVVFIAADVDGKAALCCKVSPEALQLGVKANELIKLGAGICKGGGGGRPDFAEAGGRDGGQVEAAAEAVKDKVKEIVGE